MHDKNGAPFRVLEAQAVPSPLNRVDGNMLIESLRNECHSLMNELGRGGGGNIVLDLSQWPLNTMPGDKATLLGTLISLQKYAKDHGVALVIVSPDATADYKSHPNKYLFAEKVAFSKMNRVVTFAADLDEAQALLLNSPPSRQNSGLWP